MNNRETPSTVHGRLMEAVHISGYSFERACGELEWLLDDDRWKQAGSGYTDINAFLATIDFSEFRVAIEQRKKLAKRLQAIETSQRATARLLGVGRTTINRDVKPVPNGTLDDGNDQETRMQSAASVPSGTPAWFQTDADPSKEAKRVARNQEREQQRRDLPRVAPDLPEGRFSLIYADPPWRYEHIETESRAVENQYLTLSLEEICACDVPAADDAVLFLWATSPKLAEALQVMEAWGFAYRTCAVWDKGAIGMGYYFRQQHELLLVGARGALPVPAPAARPASVIRSRRERHSKKPGLVHEILERMYPTLTEQTRLELFGRERRSGWTVWGNEPQVAAHE